MCRHREMTVLLCLLQIPPNAFCLLQVLLSGVIFLRQATSPISSADKSLCGPGFSAITADSTAKKKASSVQCVRLCMHHSGC